MCVKSVSKENIFSGPLISPPKAGFGPRATYCWPSPQSISIFTLNAIVITVVCYELVRTDVNFYFCFRSKGTLTVCRSAVVFQVQRSTKENRNILRNIFSYQNKPHLYWFFVFLVFVLKRLVYSIYARHCNNRVVILTINTENPARTATEVRF